MAVPHSSASPTPGPSKAHVRDRVADALYEWCRNNHAFGHVFNQEGLLSAGVIPNRDLKILLTTAQNLVNRDLFKIHDLKNSGGLIGWELVSLERAANYAGLDRNERMVYSIIDSAGTQGLWTKTIKNRLTAHAKVLERIYKTLEGRNLIKPMKSVQHPQRKMYIITSLQPSEDATGGAWYTDGQLDADLMESIARAIELKVSEKSWVELPAEGDSAAPVGGKRKVPHGGFDVKGKGKAKAARIDDNQPRSPSPDIQSHKPKKHAPKGEKTFVPHEPGYHGYPTLHEITRTVASTGVTRGASIPDNAINHLLEVMVYDNRLFKLRRSVHSDETPDDDDSESITMYRCFKNPAEVVSHVRLQVNANNTDRPTQAKVARRQLELEEIGRGGTSEVPCMQCPAFDLCGDGGPVNVNTCVYYDEWFVQAARADQDAGDPWPGGEDFIKEGEERTAERVKALANPAVKVTIEPEVMDLT